MAKLTCPECGKEFDHGDRATPTALEAAVVQIVYCSRRCKRKAGNRRYYVAHREDVISRALVARKKD